MIWMMLLSSMKINWHPSNVSVERKGDKNVIMIKAMRFIDYCPNCFSSSSSDEANVSSDVTKKTSSRKHRKFMKYATMVLGDSRKFSDCEYYSKFYTAAAVQPKYFCAGKKYEIERKHKIKKRDLLNGKLNRRQIIATSSHHAATDDDNQIGGEMDCYWSQNYYKLLLGMFAN